MEKITKYVANDGAEFASQLDCVNYEYSCMVERRNDIIMVDCDFNRVKGKWSTAFNYVRYLFLEDAYAKYNYQKRSRYYGFGVPNIKDIGVWLQYNCYTDAWECIDKKIKELDTIKTRLSEIAEINQ